MLPSWARRSVIPAEQCSHNQKYSVFLAFDSKVGSVSSRKSVPSSKRRNKAEHEGFAHLVSIAILLNPPPQAAPAQIFLQERPCLFYLVESLQRFLGQSAEEILRTQPAP